MKYFCQILFIASFLGSSISISSAQSCGTSSDIRNAKKLTFNSNVKGKVESKSKLHFISPIVSNKAKLEVNEVGGNLKTIMTVCKVDKNGNSSKVVTKTFNDTPSKKKNKSESFTYSFEDLKGYKILVQFDGKSVGNTFQFKAKLK